MTAEELLLELRDIQVPPAPEWWLIAPAYLLALFIVLVMIVFLAMLFRYKNRNQLVHQAHHELQQIKASHRLNADSRVLALDLSKWLKQVSILAFPEQLPASLSGQRWLNFLDQSCDTVSFSNGPGKLFAESVYYREPQFDAIDVLVLCEEWLQAIKPRLVTRGNSNA